MTDDEKINYVLHELETLSDAEYRFAFQLVRELLRLKGVNPEEIIREAVEDRIGGAGVRFGG